MTLGEFLMNHVQLNSRILIMQDTDEDIPKHEFYGKMDDKAFIKYTNGDLKYRHIFRFWFDADGVVVIVISNHY